MFPRSFFAGAYFAPTYFPPVTGEAPQPEPPHSIGGKKRPLHRPSHYEPEPVRRPDDDELMVWLI